MARKRRKKPNLRFRFRLIVAEEYRPIQFVSKLSLVSIWALILVTLGLQIQINATAAPPEARAIALPEAPNNIVMHALSVGDPVAFGKATNLWLQAFDNQQGQSISFLELDYNKVAAWLGAIAELDHKANYPQFSAARIYTAIKDPERIRIMAEFVREQFLIEPALRWEHMASIITLLKHEVDDTKLALEYANDLWEHTKDLDHVPNWAKQMKPFLLSDNNEFFDSADLLINLLNSGEVTDPQEFLLLFTRLEEIFQKMLESGQVTSQEQYLEMERKFEEARQTYLRIQEEGQ